MNGYGLAAVVVVCVTVLAAVVLWAVVRLGQQQEKEPAVEAADVGSGREGLSADEEFAAVQAHNRAGQADLRRQIAAAQERAGREKRGEF
ncbi:hypothetical protein [Streptomyces sp. NPDC048385]|uniref:hypothetical protein n=1 Tax=unclassified Streptomyces TaxID=2593676 RepID=UPI003421825C